MRDALDVFDEESVLVDATNAAWTESWDPAKDDKLTLKNVRGEQTSFRRSTDNRLTATLWMCLVDRIPPAKKGNRRFEIGIDTSDDRCRSPVLFGGSGGAIDTGSAATVRPILDYILESNAMFRVATQQKVLERTTDVSGLSRLGVSQ